MEGRVFRGESDEKKEQTKQKWKMKICSWLGTRKTGEWVSEAVVTTVERAYECFAHGAGSTKSKPVIVRRTFKELVYMHHGYRPKLDGESKTRKSFYFRGARVWRD